jgi:tetratricopeptide (TPR) repeat protein
MNINLEEGLDMIRKAVELKPDDGYIVDSLGWAYFRMNRFDDAVTELERAAELMAGDPTINDHLGDAYWRVGRKLEAVFQWNQTLALKPEEAEIPKIKAKIENGLPPIEAKVPAAADAARETLPKEVAPGTATPGKKS